MSCTAVSVADWEYFVQVFALLPMLVAFAGLVAGVLVVRLVSSVDRAWRAKRAAVPFAERAMLLEERRERAVLLWSRIVQRNRLEGLRRGDWVE